jgi:hypothetical protein
MPELAARLEEVHAVVPHPASLSRFLRKAGFTYKKTLIASERQRGVVTLSWIERNWPITANAEEWDFNDLACCSIAEIWLIALNVTTPMAAHSTGLELDQFVTTKTFSSRAIGVFYFPQNCNCRARARSISTAKRYAIFA